MVLLVLLILCPVLTYAATINVPAGQPTIQGGINAAVNGDEVVVSPGTYVENINFSGKAITVRSTNPTDPSVVVTTIIDGNHVGSVVTFASAEAAGSVLSGFTITHGSGTATALGPVGGGVYCRGSSPTLTYNNITANAVAGGTGGAGYGGGVACVASSSPRLTNNSIGGNSASGDNGAWGGGVYCDRSSPILTTNDLSTNSAFGNSLGAGYGGGLACVNSSAPNLTNNTINSNLASGHLGGWGGGVYCSTSSSPTLTQNTIGKNSALIGHGGGMYCDSGCSPTLTSNNIIGNTVTGGSAGGGVACAAFSSPILTGNTIAANTGTFGGGVYCGGGASPVLTGNTIVRNTVIGQFTGHGGGLYCVISSTPTVTNNLFLANTAGPGNGGGVYCENGSIATLTNNTFNGNSATFGGGVYCNNFSTPSLINNTLSQNSAANGGGVYCDNNCSPIIKNTIVAGNTNGGGLQCAGPTSTPVLTYCDFYSNGGGNFINHTDPTGSNGNLAVDPLFANAAGGNFRLKSLYGRWNGSAWAYDIVTSPCIDTGAPASAFSAEPVPNGGRINMGYDGNTPYASKSPGTTVVSWGPVGVFVGPRARLNILFSDIMARPSAETSLFINGVKAKTFGGTFTWLARKMTFTPAESLQPGMVYTIMIAKGARSRTGVGMVKSFTWSFTTQSSALGAVSVAAVPTAAGAQITLNLMTAANVSVSIRNLAGREVALLQPGQLAAGVQTLLWNGKSKTGTRVPSGTYLLSATTNTADGASAQGLTSLQLR